MTIPSITRDVQRATFIEGLHNSLKKQARKAIEERNRFSILAGSYIEDGLEECECVELLMIDGLDRESAESYTSMVISGEAVIDNLNEYAFQFEDVDGKAWSSYDIGKTVRASNDEDASEKADELLCSSSTIEHNKILSVSRIS